MGAGDVNGATGHTSANAIWVFDGSFGASRPAVREPEGFVAWPPRGYVPHPVVYPRCSLSYPGADFSAATVTMSRGGASVPVALEPVAEWMGEDSIIWRPDNLGTHLPADAPAALAAAPPRPAHRRAAHARRPRPDLRDTREVRLSQTPGRSPFKTRALGAR